MCELGYVQNKHKLIIFSRIHIPAPPYTGSWCEGRHEKTKGRHQQSQTGYDIVIASSGVKNWKNKWFHSLNIIETFLVIVNLSYGHANIKIELLLVWYTQYKTVIHTI